MLEQLYALGYHPKWLDYGLIDHDELALYTRGSGQTVRNLAREKLWRQLNHTERQRLFGASQSDKTW